MPPATAQQPASRSKPNGKPFLGVIDAVLVDGPVEFAFDGAIVRDDATAVWMWMVRDIASDLIDRDVTEDTPRNLAALETLMPDLLARANKAVSDAGTSVELTRRIRTQLGGDEAWGKLPAVLNALRCRGLLEKAQNFGRAANGMPDEAALALAMQSMPLQDPAVAALLMQAAVGHVAVPTRLIVAAIRIAGSPAESAMRRSGYGVLIDAIFAHAQNQIPLLNQMGTFGDIDLVCRATDRFHRLMRAVTGYVELDRTGHWTHVAAGLTTAASERLEGRLRDVAPDMNKALRKRDGTDRLDSDQILSALNGIYLLAAIRDARDSLALNAVFDQVWSQVGQALEIHTERHLEQLRRQPGDTITAARLDAAIKMTELRFNMEYADTMRRAKEIAMRR